MKPVFNPIYMPWIYPNVIYDALQIDGKAMDILLGEEEKTKTNPSAINYWKGKRGRSGGKKMCVGCIIITTSMLPLTKQTQKQ